MTGVDYTAHLLIHLIDGNDTVNAKFLYQRVPEQQRATCESFKTVWSAVIGLANGRSGDAISVLKQPFAGDASATSPFVTVINKLREIAVWHL